MHVGAAPDTGNWGEAASAAAQHRQRQRAPGQRQQLENQPG